MTDVHTSVRSAIATELDAWDVLSGLSWGVAEPAPGVGLTDTGDVASTLPKASLWFGSAPGVRSRLAVAGHDAGRVVWDKGRFTGSFMAKVWTNNADDYAAAREVFERQQLVRAIATGRGSHLCHDLTPTIYGLTCPVRIYWTGNVTFADPRETQRQSLYALSWEGLVSYPDWVREEADATTGLLDIGVEVEPESEIDLDDIDASAPLGPQWSEPSIDLTETEV